jgi:hypothetical protein
VLETGTYNFEHMFVYLLCCRSYQMHMSSPLGFSGVRVTRCLVLCVMFCRSLFVLLFLSISDDRTNGIIAITWQWLWRFRLVTIESDSLNKYVRYFCHSLSYITAIKEITSVSCTWVHPSVLVGFVLLDV